VSSAASVRGGGTLRLFCALRLPEHTLDAIEAWAIEAWQGGLSRERAGERVVPRGNLHVTLAFLGGRPAGELPAIVAELRAAAAEARCPSLRVARWRETRSVGMLVLDDEGGAATRLAQDVQSRLERLGVYRREGRPWLPHVTVLRFRERPHLAVETPDLGTIVPSDVAAYLSQLRPGGAQYEILESVPLNLYG
jgi:2'-5' RNA ligase